MGERPFSESNTRTINLVKNCVCCYFRSRLLIPSYALHCLHKASSAHRESRELIAVVYVLRVWELCKNSDVIRQKLEENDWLSMHICEKLSALPTFWLCWSRQWNRTRASHMPFRKECRSTYITFQYPFHLNGGESFSLSPS